MSLDHPLHSRPTDELLAAGVTSDQISGLHQMSNVMFGNPDRVFEVLGTPESRGDAALMLGAIHSYRSKSKPMPGRQKEYFELIRAAQEGKPKPAAPIERECRECGHVQPLSELEGPSRKCNTCKDKPTRELAAAEKAAAAPKPTATDEEEKPMETTAQTDTKTCSTCGEPKPLDELGKDKNAPDGKNRSCKPCVREQSAASRARRKKKISGTAPPKRSGKATGGGTGETNLPASADPPLPDPPLSSQNGWAVGFEDPRLSDLRRLQDVLVSELDGLTVIDLDATAKVAAAIAATFGPKGE